MSLFQEPRSDISITIGRPLKLRVGIAVGEGHQSPASCLIEHLFANTRGGIPLKLMGGSPNAILRSMHNFLSTCNYINFVFFTI